VQAPSAEPPQRVTMTLPLINAARVVAVLVTGADKAPIVQQIASGHGSVEQYPIKGVRPRQGQLKWFLDAEACAAIGEGTKEDPT
jgi:6-phosphogluconolactonase